MIAVSHVDVNPCTLESAITVELVSRKLSLVDERLALA